jgi:hypothetical protein
VRARRSAGRHSSISSSIHCEPFELVLEGPAGGKFIQGIDGERVERDAIEFIRVLAGRRPGAGLLSRPLPLSPLTRYRRPHEEREPS